MTGRTCSVAGCLRLATRGQAWCSYHRKHYAEIHYRPAVGRPDDLIETGMVVDNDTGALCLLGGLCVPVPPELSLRYYFGDMRGNLIPVLLPRARLRHFLDHIRQALAKESP